MNEHLLKFIEFCLIDGVISDKEREVIFRKSKELGVPDDECDIILEGLIFQYNKENGVSQTIRETELEKQTEEQEIKITPLIEEEIDDDFLSGVYNYNRDEQVQSLELRVSNLNEKGKLLMEERDECENQFQKLWDKKISLDSVSQQSELEMIEKELFGNDQNLMRINSELKPILEETQELEQQKHNYDLFVVLYKKTPILYQSKIFGRYLQEITVKNDEQILNLTRFNKFLIGKESDYSRSVQDCFKKVELGDITRNDVDLILTERKSLISFYNSFHLMLHSLSNNKMGVYMKIYLELEAMGMFNSFYEKEVLTTLNQINRHLNQLNITLTQVTKELSKTNNYLQLLNDHMYNVKLSIDNTNKKLDRLDYSLRDISYSISEGNRNLDRSVELLGDLNSGMRFNNLLTGIQTYQMYKINKNTKSLRG